MERCVQAVLCSTQWARHALISLCSMQGLARWRQQPASAQSVSCTMIGLVHDVPGSCSGLVILCTAVLR
jgi:hypothetical protein